MFHLDSHPDAQKLMRSRLYLIALILIFIGPLIASTILYYNPQLRTGLGGVSNGELILPPREVKQLLIDQSDNRPRWSLLYRASYPSCDLNCEATLFMMRQVRQSLGSKRDRTQLLVFFDDKRHHRNYAPMLQRLGPHRLVLRTADISRRPALPPPDSLEDCPYSIGTCQLLMAQYEPEDPDDPFRIIQYADWLLPPIFEKLPDHLLDALIDLEPASANLDAGEYPLNALYLENGQIRWGRDDPERRGITPAVRLGGLASRWGTQFEGLPPDTLYLIDPLGNLFMYYTPQSTSRGLLKDLKRLLAASRIG